MSDTIILALAICGWTVACALVAWTGVRLHKCVDTLAKEMRVKIDDHTTRIVKLETRCDMSHTPTQQGTTHKTFNM